MTSTIAIIDYGMGNLHSVAKAVQHVAPEQRVLVTQQAEQILTADRVIFPGQGAMRDCMRELAKHQLIDTVKQAAANKPFLGLCLGPQALLEYSEENGGVNGLGILAGEVRWFGHRLLHTNQQTTHNQPSSNQLKSSFKIPHMGWNQVQQTCPHALWESIPQNSRFYFVHSYYLQPTDTQITAGTTNYLFDFTSVIAKDNIFAVQFHPEKSARWGLQLLANFSRWYPG